MEMLDALNCFDALSHPGRLSVFRLLVRMAPQAARPTEIAATLALKQNTLSHHLAALEAAGLIVARRDGRSILYRPDLAALARLVGYVGLDLGRGRADLVEAFATGEGVATPGHAANVLFICSGNSARSLFAEALLRDLGQGQFIAHSAGTRPNTAPNPHALQVLTRNGHDVSGLWSKHIDVFRSPDAPRMDFVFTVCDAAAGEECPPWPGQPVTGHWGLPDPVKATGTEAEKALSFQETYAALRSRIAAFAKLPLNTLSRLSLQRAVDSLGIATATTEKER